MALTFPALVDSWLQGYGKLPIPYHHSGLQELDTVLSIAEQRENVVLTYLSIIYQLNQNAST